MRIKCLHGFFIFREDVTGEASDFIDQTGLILSPWRDVFTFQKLAAVPEYSILGKDFLGIAATKTFAGEPWEIFRANGFIYNFVTGFMVPIAAVKNRITINEIGNRFDANGIILPGSLTDEGRVTDYSAGFSKSPTRWLYSQVGYD